MCIVEKLLLLNQFSVIILNIINVKDKKNSILFVKNHQTNHCIINDHFHFIGFYCLFSTSIPNYSNVIFKILRDIFVH